MDCLPEITMEVKDVPEPEVEESENNDELINELETPKPKMSQQQIFQEPPKMKVVNEDKPVKKKRVLSEEHKQKLAVARQKALETRRKNAALKKEEKELQKKIKQNKMNDLRKQANVSVVEEKPVEVSEPIDIPKEEPKPVKPIQSLQNNLSKEDLTQITLNAIMGYDRLRKKEKAEKRKEQETIRQKEILKQQLQQTIAPPSQPKFYSTNGKWDDFF
jgi:hypothetical protein